MQTQGGTAAAEAIEAKERQFRIALYVDWSGTGNPEEPLADLSDFVESIEVERSLKGSAPEEILLVEGASAAEMSVTLSGTYAGMQLPHVFSPYNRLSPFFGKRTTGAKITWSIIVDTPVGNFVYQQFVGEIRTITPSRGDNYITITALDYVEKLRRPVIIPPWAMSDIAVQFGEIDSQVCWSHAVIDHALRQCDVGPSPKRPTTRDEMNVPDDSLDGVQFFLPANGSYIPTIGWLDNPNIDAFPNRGKAMYAANGPIHPEIADEALPPLGFLGTNGTNYAFSSPAQQYQEGVVRYWCANRDQMPGGGTHWMGMTLNNPNQARALSGTYTLFELVGAHGRTYYIHIGGGLVWARRQNAATGESVETTKVVIPPGTTPIDLLVQWDNTSESGSKCYLKVGTNDNGNFPQVGSPVTYVWSKPAYDILGRISVYNIVDMSDVFYSARNVYNSAKGSTHHAYRLPSRPAVLDRGLNRLSHIPSSKPQEAWSLITNVASAEFGSVFWDEYGVFRFWNLETMLDKQKTAVRRYSLDHLEDLKWTDTIDSVRNIFTIRASKKRAVWENKLYTSSDINEFIVPANSTARFQIWIDGVVSPLTWQLGRYGQQANVAGMPMFVDGVHGFTLQGLFPAGSQYGAGWYEYNLYLSTPNVVVYFNHEGYLIVRIDNPNDVPIRLGKGLVGQPGTYGPQMNFQGTKIKEYADQTFVVKNPDSIAVYGPKTLELSGEWYQDTFAANNMVSTLQKRTATPIPATDTITVPGDPRIQLGDTVLLDDSEGFGGNIPAQILGIRRRYGIDSGLQDVFTIEGLHPVDAPSVFDPPDGSYLERVNLSVNPTLSVDASNWYGGTGSARNATTDFPAAQFGYYGVNEIVPPEVQVDAGATYTHSVYFLPNFTGIVNVEMHWRANGEYFGNAASKQVPCTNGQLVRLDISASAPFGVDASNMFLSFTGTAVASQHLAEKSTIVGTYFDGSTSPPQTSWTGAAGNSTSKWVIGESGDDDEVVDPPEEEEPEAQRYNLCPNPAFGANLDDWYGPETPAMTRETVTGMVRPQALRIAAFPGQEVSGPRVDILPATPYVMSMHVRNDGTSTLTGLLQAAVVDSEGGWIDAYGGTNLAIPPGQVERVSITFTSPAGAAGSNISLFNANQALSITGVMYEQAETLSSYFDGETEGASWDGPQYNSSSTFGEQTTTPETPPTAEAGTAAAAKGWGLPTYWDTFNYTGAPNPAKWSVYGEGGTEGGDGKQCWPGHANEGRRCVEQVTLNGEYARLAILPNGDQAGISHRHNQTYGKWEVRARVLPKAGSTGNPGHAVLIIWPETEEWPEDGEYDFFEVNVGDTKAGAYIHYPHNESAPVQQEYAEKPGVDLTQWHNYAVEWTSTYIKGYIDGVEWFNYSGGANAIRRDIQTMPGGHLTIQIDGFFPDSVYQEGYLDVAWARVYAS